MELPSTPEFSDWDSLSINWLKRAVKVRTQLLPEDEKAFISIELNQFKLAILLENDAWSDRIVEAEMPDLYVKDLWPYFEAANIKMPDTESLHTLRQSDEFHELTQAIAALREPSDEDIARVEIYGALGEIIHSASLNAEGKLISWSLLLHILIYDSPSLPRSAISWLQNPIQVNWGRSQRLEMAGGLALPDIWPIGILLFLNSGEAIPKQLIPTLEKAGVTLPTDLNISLNEPCYLSGLNEPPLMFILSGPDGWPGFRTDEPYRRRIEETLNRCPTWYACLDVTDNPNADDARAAIDILENVPSVYLSSGLPGEDPEKYLTYLRNDDAIDPIAIALAELNWKSSYYQAQPAASDRPEGRDQLNISPVAQAFAWTVALEGTMTPLCIGIFGPWGSGKSFMMELIKKELISREKTAGAELRDEFVKDIRIVSFNAWTYAKGDLWSAMLFELFSQLREKKDLPWNERAEKLKEARENLANKRRELKSARMKVEQEERKAERIRNEKLQEIELIDAEIEKAVKATEQRISISRIDHNTIVAAMEQQGFEFTAYSIRTLTGAIRALFPFLPLSADEESEAGFTRWIPFLLAILIIGGVVFIAIDPYNWMLGFWKWVAGIAGTIAGIWSFLSRGFKKLRDGDAKLNEKLQEARASIENARNSWNEIKLEFEEENKNQLDPLLKQREEVQKEIGRVDSGVTEVEKELAEKHDATSKAEADMEEAQRQYGEPKATRGLDEFVSTRLAEGDYAQRLGNLQRVEDDLAELANIISTSTLKGKNIKAPERIILFIDDLDRCPPNQVVDVLEAIQLLLAENRKFGKTQDGKKDRPHPFIVVLGADTRILTRALETHYQGILDPDDAPDGLDYLEKIIQIPYRVPPIDEHGYELYINKLGGVKTTVSEALRTGPDENEDGRTPVHDRDMPEELEMTPLPINLQPSFELITPDDLIQLQSFQVLSASYPRAIKRMMNQYRLCKLMSFGQDFAKREYAFMLAIASGFRLATRKLVVQLAETTLPQDHTIISIVSQIRTDHIQKLKQTQKIAQSKTISDPDIESDTDRLEPDPLLLELELLIPRLNSIQNDLPTPVEVKAILRSVLPYCFLGDFENITARTA